jgi:hypothetical protein
LTDVDANKVIETNFLRADHSVESPHDSSDEDDENEKESLENTIKIDAPGFTVTDKPSDKLRREMNKFLKSSIGKFTYQLT